MLGPLSPGSHPAIVEHLASQGIHPPTSPQQIRLESDVARFLGREYEHFSTRPPSTRIVTNRGPILAEPDALMACHYNANPALFAAFLDSRYMAYSMGWYGDEPPAIRASQASLEEAQRAKLALVVDRAAIAGDERILDLGCGFGPLETFLAEVHPRVQITALTASLTQANYIEACRREHSHALATGDLRLIVGEFGAMSVDSLGAAAYDLIIAVAVFEQAHNLPAAFTKIAALLRPGGRVFLHLITSRVPIPRLLEADRSLTARYFPGGRVWPFDTVIRQTAPLNLEASWFINGLNYWRTLDEWHHRFWRNLPKLYPGILDTEDVRHWNQYFSLCKACFSPADGACVGVGHFLLRRSG